MAEVRDYLGELEETARGLILREFPGAALYRGDPAALPRVGEGGAFAVEAANSAFVADPEGPRRVAAVRIWTYADDVRAVETVRRRAQHLEEVLLVARPRVEYVRTVYMTRDKGRAFRRRAVGAACTEWRVGFTRPGSSL
jgi:hypothetical protein